MRRAHAMPFGAEPVTMPQPPAGEIIYRAGVYPTGHASLHLEPGAVHLAIVAADA